MKVHIGQWPPEPHVASPDVQQVTITDHPLASKGRPKRVAFCGKTADAPIGFIVEHGLQPHEQQAVVDEVRKRLSAPKAEVAVENAKDGAE